jgi:hypothetical protein
LPKKTGDRSVPIYADVESIDLKGGPTMHIPLSLIKVFLTLTISLVFTTTALGADDAQRIEPEQLKAKLDQPGLYLLDVRIVSDWKKSDRKIPGAVRVDPHDVSSWAGKYPKDGSIVVYCS